MLSEAVAFRATRAAEEEMADDDAPGGRGASPSAAAPLEEGEVRMPARSRWLDADSDEEEEGGASTAAAPSERARSGEAQAAPPPTQVVGASPEAHGAEQPGDGGGTLEPTAAASAPPSRPASERVRLDDDDDDDDDSGALAASPTPGRASTPGGASDAGSAMLLQEAHGSRRVFSTVSFSGKPMPPGLACRSVDVYEKLHKIDEGTYGVVYKARERKTGDVVALKQVKLLTVKEGFPVTALREINVLLSLSHPNIINVREMVVGNSMDKIFMVMDFMEHDLKGLMHAMKVPFTASEVKRLMLDLTSAIEYCHEHWVLHRDLKTSNLLMNNRGMVMVCDFGLARKYGDPLKPYTNMVVTLWYRPPELLLGGKTYGPALDMWSLGCIFAELVLRQPLLPGRGEFDQIDRIFKLLGTPNESIWPGCQQLPHFKKFSFKNQPFNHLSDKFKTGPSFTAGGTGLSSEGVKLMDSMLCLNPDRRITAREALDHPYFKESPAPKAHHLMPTMPTTHAGKGKQTVKSVDAEEEKARESFALR